MTNYASHVKDAGMDPDTIPLTFFRKASGSISGPFDDIVKPSHVRFLDYEVEIGLVIGRDIPVGTTQFYEAKSYPTFTPVGPAVVLLGPDELKRFGELRLQLWVNGELRQNSTVRTDMVCPPLQALQSLSRFQELAPGDVVEARVATDDSTIDLGAQRTVVSYE